MAGARPRHDRGGRRRRPVGCRRGTAAARGPRALPRRPGCGAAACRPTRGARPGRPAGPGGWARRPSPGALALVVAVASPSLAATVLLVGVPVALLAGGGAGASRSHRPSGWPALLLWVGPGDRPPRRHLVRAGLGPGGRGRHRRHRRRASPSSGCRCSSPPSTCGRSPRVRFRRLRSGAAAAPAAPGAAAADPAGLPSGHGHRRPVRVDPAGARRAPGRRRDGRAPLVPPRPPQSGVPPRAARAVRRRDGRLLRGAVPGQGRGPRAAARPGDDPRRRRRRCAAVPAHRPRLGRRLRLDGGSAGTRDDPPGSSGSGNAAPAGHLGGHETRGLLPSDRTDRRRGTEP